MTDKRSDSQAVIYQYTVDGERPLTGAEVNDAFQKSTLFEAPQDPVDGHENALRGTYTYSPPYDRGFPTRSILGGLSFAPRVDY